MPSFSQCLSSGTAFPKDLMIHSDDEVQKVIEKLGCSPKTWSIVVTEPLWDVLSLCSIVLDAYNLCLSFAFLLYLLFLM